MFTSRVRNLKWLKTFSGFLCIIWQVYTNGLNCFFKRIFQPISRKSIFILPQSIKAWYRSFPIYFTTQSEGRTKKFNDDSPCRLLFSLQKSDFRIIKNILILSLIKWILVVIRDCRYFPWSPEPQIKSKGSERISRQPLISSCDNARPVFVLL